MYPAQHSSVSKRKKREAENDGGKEPSCRCPSRRNFGCIENETDGNEISKTKENEINREEYVAIHHSELGKEMRDERDGGRGFRNARY